MWLTIYRYQPDHKGVNSMAQLDAVKDILRTITKEPVVVVCLVALGVVGFALYVVLRVIEAIL